MNPNPFHEPTLIAPGSIFSGRLWTVQIELDSPRPAVSRVKGRVGAAVLSSQIPPGGSAREKAENFQGERNRLLPQPDGFEGLRPVAIEPKGYRLPSPQLPKPSDAPIYPRRTFPALTMAVKHRDHRVTRDARLLDVPAVALPCVSYSGIKPSPRFRCS